MFSGVVGQASILSPRVLMEAFPTDPEAWLGYLDSQGGLAAGSVRVGGGALVGLTRAGLGALRDPLANALWALEVAAKAVNLAGRQISEVVAGV